jgi:hypothetical protein
MAHGLTRSFKPAEYAEARGISVDKVLSWIRSGELQAINVAQSANGQRPRYRIATDAIERFETARSTCPTPATTPRRVRNKPVKEFV